MRRKLEELDKLCASIKMTRKTNEQYKKIIDQVHNITPIIINYSFDPPT